MFCLWNGTPQCVYAYGGERKYFYAYGDKDIGAPGQFMKKKRLVGGHEVLLMKWFPAECICLWRGEKVFLCLWRQGYWCAWPIYETKETCGRARCFAYEMVPRRVCMPMEAGKICLCLWRQCKVCLRLWRRVYVSRYAYGGDTNTLVMPTEAIKPVSTGWSIIQEKPAGRHEILFEMVSRGMCSACGGEIYTSKGVRFSHPYQVEVLNGSALLHPIIIFIIFKATCEYNTNSDNTIQGRATVPRVKNRLCTTSEGAEIV